MAPIPSLTHTEMVSTQEQWAMPLSYMGAYLWCLTLHKRNDSIDILEGNKIDFS